MYVCVYMSLTFVQIGVPKSLHSQIFLPFCEFPLTQKKKTLTTEMNFRSYFHFKWIPEREREKVRAREGDRDPVSAVRTSKLQSTSFASTRAVDCDPRSWTRLRADRDRRDASWDRDRRFARSRRWSRSRLRADHDRRRGRRTGAREAPRRQTQSIASVNLGAVFVFLVLSFSL